MGKFSKKKWEGKKPQKVENNRDIREFFKPVQPNCSTPIVQSTQQGLFFKTEYDYF